MSHIQSIFHQKELLMNSMYIMLWLTGGKGEPNKHFEMVFCSFFPFVIECIWKKWNCTNLVSYLVIWNCQARKRGLTRVLKSLREREQNLNIRPFAKITPDVQRVVSKNANHFIGEHSKWVKEFCPLDSR